MIYDCLFPHTVGGAERWYRDVAEQLADGHEVTYITRRQWPAGELPDGPAGSRVVALAGDDELYSQDGSRAMLPPVRFGLGVLGHLLRHRHRYDVIHTASFPYFPLLAAVLVRLAGGPPVIVDWHEVWTRAYWVQYVGRLTGSIGWVVQAVCVRATARAFTFSRLHARRLVEEGLRGEVTVLPGEWSGPVEPRAPVGSVRPSVLFAGRLIAEKRPLSIPPVVASIRLRREEVTATILGQGPIRQDLEALVSELGLEDVVRMPGFVGQEELERELGTSACLLLPSVREGYGQVVVQAASFGTPSVVVAHPDNAATELVEPGRNGFIAPSTDPEALAEAIERVLEAGERLRASTREWFAERAPQITVERSLEVIEDGYRQEIRP
ncbi:MAG: glycosyltransferase family 4 protein [Solirubrobacterales bacterium]